MHFQENNLYCEKDENAGVEIGIIRKIKRERVCEIWGGRGGMQSTKFRGIKTICLSITSEREKILNFVSQN